MIYQYTVLGLLAFVLTGCHKVPDETTTGFDRPPVAIRTARAEMRTLTPTFEVVGTVLAVPDRAATLTAAIPGLIDQLAAAEGTCVKKGQLIVRLDERKAKTDLSRAEAAYARLIAKPRPDELVVAHGAVEKAKAAHAVTQSQLNKAKLTKETNPNLVTDIQLLDYQRAERIAATDVDDAEAQYRLLELGPREEQRKEAYVEVEATKLQLDYCRISAPLDGEVVELLARVGMKADVGMTVARILDSSEVLIQARVPGNRLVGVTNVVRSTGTGPVAVIRSGSFPGEVFLASSGWMSQQTEALTADVPVKLLVPNPRGLLRIGMSVRVELHEPGVTGIAIPEAAITVNEEGHRVVTAVRNGKAYPVEIEIESPTELEIRAQGWVRVLKGLNVGDEVATENGYALPDDTPVTILPARTLEPAKIK